MRISNGLLLFIIIVGSSVISAVTIEHLIRGSIAEVTASIYEVAIGSVMFASGYLLGKYGGRKNGEGYDFN